MKRLIMGMVLAAILASLSGCIIVSDHDRGRDHDRDERHEEHHDDER